MQTIIRACALLLVLVGHRRDLVLEAILKTPRPFLRIF